MLRFDRDVTEIRGFYHSRLGRWAARRLNRILRSCWPDMRGKTVLGIGYAIPFHAAWPDIKPLAVMTASQGVVRWPNHGPCATVLTEDHILPFGDETFDRIIIAHELENTDYASALLSEVWRVLTPQGRVIMIVPNRLGWWARFDTTPFGFGHTFSSRQLRQLLQAHQFIWLQRHYSLFGPPSQRSLWLSLLPLWEWLGQRFFPKLGGVLVAEASKQVYSITPIAKAPPSQPKRVRVDVGELNPSPAG